MNGPLAARLEALPVMAVAARLREALIDPGAAVLEAPPGSGKTTGVPLALLDEQWADTGRIVMLEPRRLAARAAAERLAENLGERLGHRVGLRTRGDNVVSRRNRIEVVTEGVLNRMLQSDPTLTGVAAVLFDEVHERSLNCDLGLALVAQVRSLIRPDLRVLAMSATLDGGPIAALFGGAPIVRADGRSFPVETIWCPPPPGTDRSGPALEAAVVEAVARALREQTHDVLVFLPGIAEMRRVAGRMASWPVEVVLLHGSMPRAEQNRALRRGSDGARTVVVASAVAETSVTIEGIGAVVDAGLSRRGVFEPRRALPTLETVRVSRASADQRRGRAGRLGPGRCYRLWSEAEHARLAPDSPPEITAADLAPLALDLAAWGDPDGSGLEWLTPPPAGHMAQARMLLQRLDLVDDAGHLTEHGSIVARMGVHPRLGHMLITGARAGMAAEAADVAALLGEGAFDRAGVADLAGRLAELARRPSGDAVRVDARRLLERLSQPDVADAPGVRESDTGQLRSLGWLVANAYPDRVGRRRSPGSARVLLANGAGAVIGGSDTMLGHEYLVALVVDGGSGPEATIRLAEPLPIADLEALTSPRATWCTVMEWDRSAGDVRIERELRWEALVLRRAPGSPGPADLAAFWRRTLASEGIELLPWSPAATALRHRMAACRSALGEPWPSVEPVDLLGHYDDWLAPTLSSVRNRRQLDQIDLTTALAGLLPWPLRRELEDAAPRSFTTPTGRAVAIDYSGEQPSVAVRLQELFGQTSSPSLLGGRMPLVVHLLSPAGRPVAVTADLASFWTGPYQEVRKELRGRYPKHDWPVDPLTASPRRGPAPRGSRPSNRSGD